MTGGVRKEPADLDEPERSHLRHAIALAAEARAAGDPPFGSVLVDQSGEVLAAATNTTRTDDDITAHPELKLARLAARRLTAEQAARATLYTSCRPCPMCANALARSGIGRVVFALDTGDLDALKPEGYVNPDAGAPRYVGPALVAEAQEPLAGYY